VRYVQVVSVYPVDNFIVDGTVSTVLDHNVGICPSTLNLNLTP